MKQSALLLLSLLAACQTKPIAQQDTPAAPTAVRPVPAAPLRNTRWVARELAGQALALPADTREVYLLLRNEGNTAEGHAGCNRFGGSVTVASPDQLTFGPLRSTRMACPALATESSFLQALEATRRYRISGDTLRLFDASSPQPLARLEAVYLR